MGNYFVHLDSLAPDGPVIGVLSNRAFRAWMRLLVTSGAQQPYGVADDGQVAALPAALRDELQSSGALSPEGHVFGFRGRRSRGFRRRIPSAVRRAVYSRDRWACVLCGARERLTLDHVLPWSRGGTDDVLNLQTLCLSCNCRKGARI